MNGFTLLLLAIPMIGFGLTWLMKNEYLNGVPGGLSKTTDHDNLINAKLGTFLSKKILPLVWMGASIFAAISYASPYDQARFQQITSNPQIFLFAGIFIVLTLYALNDMKKSVFPLMDEVYDKGKSLLIRKGKHKISLLLTDIIDIDYTVTHRNRSYSVTVLLTTKNETIFGKQISFTPIGMASHKKHPDIQNLIDRIEQGK